MRRPYGVMIATATIMLLLATGCQRPLASSGKGASSRLSGQVIEKSDVSSIGSEPIAKGQVVLIPQARFVDLARVGAFDPTKQAIVRTTSFRMTNAEIAALEARTAAIGSDGRFAIELPSGRYVLCLIDIFPDDGGASPHWVRGCSQLDVRSVNSSVTVTFGIGGVGIER
jgi:hypothetical protein